MIAAIPTGLLVESVATRLNPATIGDRKLAINFAISDRNEKVKVSVGNSVMISEMDVQHDQPQATVTGPRQLFLAMLFLKLPIAQLEMAGLKVEGDKTVVEALQASLDPIAGAFNIVEP